MRLGISAVEILAFHQPAIAADPAAFEVASIKPGNPRNPATLLNYSNPRLFIAGNMSLITLMMFAWNVTEQQIPDAPRWADTERWDITARTESPLPSGIAANEPIATRWHQTPRGSKDRPRAPFHLHREPVFQRPEDAHRNPHPVPVHATWSNRHRPNRPRIEPSKTPAEALVIERAARPSAN
jgi:hypothetical protein